MYNNAKYMYQTVFLTIVHVGYIVFVWEHNRNSYKIIVDSNYVKSGAVGHSKHTPPPKKKNQSAQKLVNFKIGSERWRRETG
jgi:hypothetical protein